MSPASHALGCVVASSSLQNSLLHKVPWEEVSTVCKARSPPGHGCFPLNKEHQSHYSTELLCHLIGENNYVSSSSELHFLWEKSPSQFCFSFTHFVIPPRCPGRTWPLGHWWPLSLAEVRDFLKSEGNLVALKGVSFNFKYSTRVQLVEREQAKNEVSFFSNSPSFHKRWAQWGWYRKQNMDLAQRNA